ncbi:hypothetical protein TIFTF001_021334 [Ficus carica]|uniref:Uncharacterized protein n=1 Tax=Ficus carica TaxID=3494 RepID=A0AA88DDK1_FICCA|nr:hypothetical protein TIFTF001_021334 [Ficus carica]
MLNKDACHSFEAGNLNFHYMIQIEIVHRLAPLQSSDRVFNEEGVKAAGGTGGGTAQMIDCILALAVCNAGHHFLTSQPHLFI